MAHFAKLSEENIVISLHVVKDEDTIKNGVEDEATGIAFLTKIHGWPHWRRYSYNMRNGYRINPDGSIAEDQSKAFRKNAAGIGGKYDSIRDAFIDPKPYNSWILNETTCVWEPPVPRPKSDTNGVPDRYHWKEDTLSYTKEVLYREPEANQV
jgi:hypothetical protein